MKNFGFTLAEVLITLGIIGIVAAITLPVLIQKQIDRGNVARLQKTYSILSQALLRAKEEQGEFATWSAYNNAKGCAKIFSYIEPYVKTIKKCGNKTGCWAETPKSLTGETAYWFDESSSGLSGIYSFVLNDGTYVMIDIFGSRYDFLGLNSDVKSFNFIGFWVDVNGNKAPNVVGRDIFMFALANKGLVPFGYANNSANCDTNIKSSHSGYDCTFKVLQEKKINY